MGFSLDVDGTRAFSMLKRAALSVPSPRKGMGVTFIGLKSTGIRSLVYWLLVIFTAGIFFLAAKILPYVQASVRFAKSSLEEADRILVRRYDEGTAVYEIIKVHRTSGVRWLEYMCYRYLWTRDDRALDEAWVKVKYALEEKSFRNLFDDHSTGISFEEARDRVERYGSNSLEVPVPSYFKLFYTEVIHPFYIFQVVSIAIWLWDDYWIYATCIFIMAVASALYGVWQARKNREMLAEMCLNESVVRVVRRSGPVDGSVYIDTISSKEIAPGDLVEIRADMDLPCDLLLIQGQCVVNESALTGESVPVAKVSIPSQESEIYHPEVHGAKHILYNGTGVLQVRPEPHARIIPSESSSVSFVPSSSSQSSILTGDSELSLTSEADLPSGSNIVLGLAISTGFSTAKGDLIRSIMFPRPTRFKFYRDSMRFVGVLLCIALIGLVYTIIIFSKYGSPVASMLKRALDLITITVPPALPIAMSIATAFSVQRLKMHSIFCTSPQRVNVCGRIDVMCFDKTGTLTEDHLDVHGVLPASPLGDSNKSTTTKFQSFQQDVPNTSPQLLKALASCHSLNRLHGNLIGDPLEIKMFEATGWNLVDDPTSSVRSPDLITSIATAKFFEFSSLLQRMSVVVEERSLEASNMAGTYWVISKGAPEVIKTLCLPATVPATFDKELSNFTQQGKRVLALARKPLPQVSSREEAKQISRQEAESKLSFLGLFVLQNQLKHDTAEAILNINGGTVANVMVTGDNEFTAINVARQCGILAENEEGGRSPAVYLISLDYANDIPTGLKYTYIPGIDANGPDGEARRHTTLDFHESMSMDFLPDAPLSISSLPRGTSYATTSSSLYSDDGDPRTTLELDSFNDSETSRLNLYNSGPSIASPSSSATESSKTIIHSSIDDIAHVNRVFAVHGKAFEFIRTNDRHLYAHILSCGRVYARMSPLDKAHLIEGLQSLGHTVGMCGDGANDVGALKAADVGLSLSDAEASVAAPFTSKIPSIQSMWTLLREGRCALASSISCYKYMAVYSMIQLSTCVILYSIWWDARLTDPQFLWIDIFLVFPLSFLMGRTEPRHELSSRKPPGALVSLSVVGSVVIQTLLHFLSQLSFFIYLTSSYIPTYHSGWDREYSTHWRVGALFMFANFEYIGSCLAYSISRPWRKTFVTNWPFAISLLLLFAGNIYMVVFPHKWIAEKLEIFPMEAWLKALLIAVALVEMGIAWLLERLIIIAWLQPYEEKNSKLTPLEHWADDPKIKIA